MENSERVEFFSVLIHDEGFVRKNNKCKNPNSKVQTKMTPRIIIRLRNFADMGLLAHF